MTAFNAALKVCVVVGLLAGAAWADSFGTGADQFRIDFVTISGATNPTSGYGIVRNDYRMGTFEITNDQWNKFKAGYGTVTGSPSYAYDSEPYWTGMNVPTNRVSWYEAAQFVNWLNTSTGHQAAYKFTGTQGTSNYTLSAWTAAEADNGTNLFRHKDAKYYLPSENEWVKAAYWNGTSLQTYATQPGETLYQGNGTNGGWNYYTSGYATNPYGPWAVGSGSQELNGTYDMMGNVWEWMETPYSSGDYGASSYHWLRGGSYLAPVGSYSPPMEQSLASSTRNTSSAPNVEGDFLGFRVASEVPEPCSLVLLSFGSVVLLKRRRR